MPKMVPCSGCGERLVYGNAGEERFCSFCRTGKRAFIEKHLQKDQHGNPLCPECKSSMVLEHGKWSCQNEKCSVIKIAGRHGKIKIYRDSVMATKEAVIHA